MYWKAPTENLICGDVDGNITFQARRSRRIARAGSGRLPVPGTGKYEWNGFRTELPRIDQPAEGLHRHGQQQRQPPGYWPPVMFKTLNNVPFERITRVEQVLNAVLATTEVRRSRTRSSCSTIT